MKRLDLGQAKQETRVDVGGEVLFDDKRRDSLMKQEDFTLKD